MKIMKWLLRLEMKLIEEKKINLKQFYQITSIILISLLLFSCSGKKKQKNIIENSWELESVEMESGFVDSIPDSVQFYLNISKSAKGDYEFAANFLNGEDVEVKGTWSYDSTNKSLSLSYVPRNVSNRVDSIKVNTDSLGNAVANLMLGDVVIGTIDNNGLQAGENTREFGVVSLEKNELRLYVMNSVMNFKAKIEPEPTLSLMSFLRGALGMAFLILIL